MLKSLHIENFRCFKKIDINEFGLINVLVGANGSGKTALLESIFLAGGSPDMSRWLSYWRGIGDPTPIQRTRDGYEALWKDMFFQLNQNSQIVIELKGTPENQRTLTINYAENALATSIGIPKELMAETLYPKWDSFAIRPIVFQVIAGNKTYELRPEIGKEGNLVTQGELPPTTVTALFHSTMMVATAWAAGLYSEFSKKHQENRIKQTFINVFPAIKDISLEQNADHTWGIYCDLPNMPEKLPLGFVSSGMQKLFGILLAIVAQPNGIVLVDEVENGLYYKTFYKMWEALFAFAKEYNTQLLLSTHSRECLLALAPLLKGEEDKFRLMRSEKTNEGSHEVRVFNGKDFEAALETGTEFR